MFTFQFLNDEIDQLTNRQVPNGFLFWYNWNFSLQILKSKKLVCLNFWDISRDPRANIYLSMETMWAHMVHDFRIKRKEINMYIHRLIFTDRSAILGTIYVYFYFSIKRPSSIKMSWFEIFQKISIKRTGRSQIINDLTSFLLHMQPSMYRTCAIITCGLYIFTPIFTAVYIVFYYSAMK